METNEIVKLTRAQIKSLIEQRRGEPVDTDEYEGQERRQQTRWAFPGTVEIQLADDESHQLFGTCRDISMGGVGVKAEEVLDAGSLVNISVHLKEMTLFGQAIIRYCQELDDDEEYILGLEFVYPD